MKYYQGDQVSFNRSLGGRSVLDSIKLITGLLEQKNITFEPEKAAPYRSYLALYLWEMLDRKSI